MPDLATSERPVARLAAYSARPTVLVDGTRDDGATAMLRACVVREAEGGLSHLSLTLSNWGHTQAGHIGYLFDAGSAIGLGTTLKLYFGDTGAPRALFEGQVHAIEASANVGTTPEITFLAEDKLFAARLARRSAVYEDCDVAEVVRRVADRLGVRADIGDLGAASGTWVQLNESDLAFLRRLLTRHDADLQLSGDALQVRRIADRDRGRLRLSMHSQLQRVRVIADLADQATGVTVGGFDVTGGAAFQATSRGAAAGPGAGRTAASLLGGMQPRSEHLAPLACRNETEARALADAAFDQRARRFVRLHGCTEGNAELRVGTVVEIEGVGRRFDGAYAVVEATHRFDGSIGYQTDFLAQSAYLPNP